MKLGESIYKLVPVSLCDIRGVEGWLEEQSAQGLFPLHLGGFARFCRREGPRLRFRLEPFGRGKEPSQTQLELYGAAGWRYAMAVGGAYFLFYTQDPAAPELHTDLATRGMSLDRLARRLRTSIWWQLLWLAVLLGLLFSPLLLARLGLVSRFDIQPDPGARLPLLVLNLGHPLSLPILVFMAACIPVERREYKILLDTHRNLREGLPPPPSPGPSRKIAWRNGLFLAAVPLIWLMGLCSAIHVRWTIPLENFRRPYIALEQIEQTPVARWDALFGPDEASYHHDENQVQRQLSLLAPVWYTVEEEVYEIDSPVDNIFSPVREEGHRYAPRMTMVRMRLLIPAMARSVARSQMDELRLVNLWWEYEEVDCPDADFVLLARSRDGSHQMAALTRGGWVAVFRYGGEEDLRDHLHTLAAVLQ